MPILYVADKYFPGQQIIQTAGTITLLMFGGLTAFVMISRPTRSATRPGRREGA